MQACCSGCSPLHLYVMLRLQAIRPIVQTLEEMNATSVQQSRQILQKVNGVKALVMEQSGRIRDNVVLRAESTKAELQPEAEHYQKWTYVVSIFVDCLVAKVLITILSSISVWHMDSWAVEQGLR